MQAEGLGMRFGPHLLFRELCLRLDGGRSLAVTGANGSGKSTLLRLLAGVLGPRRGVVTLRVNDREIAPGDRPLHTGLVAPYAQVYGGFSARENLAFIAKARRLSSPGARIDRMLAEVQLDSRADDRVNTYSSGMKQRVKVAAALVSQPALLLLDEPGATLDAEGRAMIGRIVERQKEAGRLVVIATNDPREAEGCDQELRVSDFR